MYVWQISLFSCCVGLYGCLKLFRQLSGQSFMGLTSIYCILNVRFGYDDYVEILFILSSRVVTSHFNLKVVKCDENLLFASLVARHFDYRFSAKPYQISFNSRVISSRPRLYGNFCRMETDKEILPQLV